MFPQPQQIPHGLYWDDATLALVEADRTITDLIQSGIERAVTLHDPQECPIDELHHLAVKVGSALYHGSLYGEQYARDIVEDAYFFNRYRGTWGATKKWLADASINAVFSLFRRIANTGAEANDFAPLYVDDKPAFQRVDRIVALVTNPPANVNTADWANHVSFSLKWLLDVRFGVTLVVRFGASAEVSARARIASRSLLVRDIGWD